jgi:hypothetical protein
MTEKIPKGADPELEIYRSVLETPTEFKNGFTGIAVAGAFFCGLLMMPGAIYLSLITGQSIAAAWVTVIIFSEVSRRAMRTVSKQELVILLTVSGAMTVGVGVGLAGGPIAQLIWRQYLIQSDAVRDIGLTGQFPSWWVPDATSEAITERNLLHRAWMIPVVIMLFMHVVGRIKSYTLGYFFFRLTSDVERLPFPFAGIAAQGAMALAESGERHTTWKWRVFSLGAMIGIGFGILQIGVPLVTGTFLNKPIMLIPLPWYDATTLTEGFMPATPTGLVIDMGLIIVGMVVPFWAVMGTLASVILTLVLNPALQFAGILTRWQPGMDTVSTTFNNSIDFWMSFTIGVAGSIAVISVYQSARDLIKKRNEIRARTDEVASNRSIWETPEGRGDFSPWVALIIYAVSSIAVIWLCCLLIPPFPMRIWFLVFFTFLYTPLISYINARLIGIVGQHVDIPFVREAAYILSGSKGVDIWLAPIPIENYGARAQDFRSQELTGTNFWSYVKADCLIVPLIFILSFAFWAFIWKSAAIPSDMFPFAQKMWDLQAKNTVLLYSATLPTDGVKPLFYEALHPEVIGGAFGFGMISFIVLTLFKLPVMAVYGFVQGVGQMPHAFIPIVIGAFIGKYYFHKRFGQKRWLEIAPVLAAGYGTGIGLIALLGVSLNLIIKAISPAPF